ncbi:protein phosphatase 1 regulatory subunit 1C isoform X3 [Symphalangus syndactylus]|uniref:protein phosphatase 1 regulatory subunit 1C isoform X3 n=1 Tax=Symphalangus syndactylus TaxID=9590 RepID=UPI002441B7EB|nr:protein phosphatase 1 regulatory subunit 1C isoform X3 [Symphalangus syndactylus]
MCHLDEESVYQRGEVIFVAIPLRQIPETNAEIDDKKVPNTQEELQNASPKQRKQSVYTPPTIKGIKHLKGQNESAFPEEEEGTNEREEQRDH